MDNDKVGFWLFPSTDSYNPPTTDTPLNLLITGNNERKGEKKKKHPSG